MHQLAVYLFCFRLRPHGRPAIQGHETLDTPFLLLVRSLRALAPQLAACVRCVVAAPARAIAEVVATGSQASLAFGDGRSIASAFLALALPRHLVKKELHVEKKN